MKGYVPDYDLQTPRSLAEALAWLRETPDEWRLFAGGTDVMVQFEAGLLPSGKFLNLWPLQELHGITVTAEKIVLGALTTYTQVRAHPLLQAEFPMLCQAASVTGGLAIQNRGTLGGNIANASPAADTPPALLAYDAQLELVSAHGTRRIAYNAFHLGYKKMDLQPGEIVAAIHLPRRRETGTHYYRKVGTRQAQAISKVCFAGWMSRTEENRIVDIRLAVASVSPTVVRCYQTESVLRGQLPDERLHRQARAALIEEISPIGDIRSTERYRQIVAANLLTECLTHPRA